MSQAFSTISHKACGIKQAKRTAAVCHASTPKQSNTAKQALAAIILSSVAVTPAAFAGLEDAGQKLSQNVGNAGAQLQDATGGSQVNPLQQLQKQVQGVTDNVFSPGQGAQDTASEVSRKAEEAQKGVQKAGDEASKKADEARRKVGV